MHLINLMFCFLAVYFMVECKENRPLYWLNVLSLVLNYAAFVFAMLV
jgi:hypothetical protein